MTVNSNTTCKPDYKARNTLLIKALLNNQSPEDNLNIIASKLFVNMTGQKLYRQTDIVNGEDYHYLAMGNQGMSSLRLHPQVSHWFGWYTNSGHSIKDLDVKLIVMNKSNADMAKMLKERFDEFQKPQFEIDLNDEIDFSKTAGEIAQAKDVNVPEKVSCIEQILLDNRPYLQGEDLFVMFQNITGEIYLIGTENYDEAGHTEYHEWLESSMGIKLTGKLTFIDARGDEVYQKEVQSMHLGKQKVS